MKVLVTGAAGFLAPHVARAFRQEGHEVRLTDLKKPADGGDSESILIADLADLEAMRSATEGVDVVCHLGGIGDVYLALERPDLAASANVVGTATLAEASQLNGVRKLVYASTWEVYGEPAYQPIDEDHPCRPDHPYGITKLAGERLALAYDSLKGLPAVALRLGTAYGTGMRPNSVFTIFIERAMQGQPITVQGSGEQARQFTHASDIGRAFVLAALSPARGAAFNVVAPASISIRQLANWIAEDLPTEITYGPWREGDVPSAEVSAEKAESLLGWKAEAGFREGLSDLIAHHSR